MVSRAPPLPAFPLSQDSPAWLLQFISRAANQASLLCTCTKQPADPSLSAPSPGLADAQNSRLSLEKRTTRLLSSNADLAARMQSLDDVFLNRGGPGDSLPDYMAAAYTPRLLQRTPVLVGSRSRLWSTLSGYSLADIPVLSIIPIPVTVAEVQDGGEFYTFDFARRVSHDLSELMKEDAGQGTSRILGAILGKQMPSGSPVGSSTNSPRSTPPATVVVPQARKKKRWR